MGFHSERTEDMHITFILTGINILICVHVQGDGGLHVCVSVCAYLCILLWKPEDNLR